MRGRECPFRLRARPEVLHGRCRPRRTCRDDRRSCRAHRGRQVDDHKAARKHLLGPDGGRASQSSTSDLHDQSAQESLRRQLGMIATRRLPLRGQRSPRTWRVRPAGVDARGDRRADARRGGGRVDQAAGGMATKRSSAKRGSRLSLGREPARRRSRAALLADPRILILDEATSSVDIVTERKMDARPERLLHRANSVSSSRTRLSTIREADLIVVLETARSSSREHTTN